MAINSDFATDETKPTVVNDIQVECIKQLSSTSPVRIARIVFSKSASWNTSADIKNLFERSEKSSQSLFQNVSICQIAAASTIKN